MKANIVIGIAVGILSLVTFIQRQDLGVVCAQQNILKGELREIILSAPPPTRMDERDAFYRFQEQTLEKLSPTDCP